jgi:hypothetical protein
MKKSPVLLAVTALLFVGWLGYLAVQVWKYRTPPVVVSRAQLLAAKYDVVAEVRAKADGRPDGDVTVRKVLFAADAAGPKDEDRIMVGNLVDCDGFAGPGPYVLPLSTTAEGHFRVAGLPFDPGRAGDPRPRVYPDTTAVREQFQALRR